MPAPRDHEDLCATALAGLPYMRPEALSKLLAHELPSRLWARVLADRDEFRPSWRAIANALDLDQVGEQLDAVQATVLRLGCPDYPAALASDHEAPAVLFARGELALLDDRARVAVIGTRQCTHYGKAVARQIGRDLGELGVTVVSGLAAGIDAAAHEGALAGAGCHDPDAGPGVHRPVPIGVVGSGFDVVYPPVNARLWERVATGGLLLSEAPPGAPPEPWRFPARNRIIAALAHVLVVVESHAAGGSMHTVRAAWERGVEVLAVPGSIHSPSSVGTNILLREGGQPYTDVDDAIVALNRARPTRPAIRPTKAATPDPSKANDKSAQAAVIAGLDELSRSVLESMGWEACNLDQILLRTGLRPGPAGVALEELRGLGLARETAGWWEREAPQSARKKKRVSTVR
jgi:DNA processing protein